MTNFFASILNNIYNMIGNYGISIIVFTIFIRLVLLPLSISAKKGMIKQAEMSPKMAEIKKKHGKDKEVYNQKIMELYKKEKFNPLSGCLPMLIQLPIIFVLFGIFRNAAKYVPAEALSQSFLWLPNMVSPDNLVNIIPGIDFFTKLPGLLPIIAAFFTYLTAKKGAAATKNNPSGQQGPNMGFMTTLFPLMILVFGASYSAGLILYWATTNIVQYIQDILIEKYLKKEKVF